MTKPTKPGLTAEGLAFCWACGLMLLWGAARFDGFFLLLGLAGAGLIGFARRRVSRNLAGIAVERRQPREIFAGEPFRIDFLIESAARRGAHRSVRLRDSLSPGPGGADVSIAELSPGERQTAGVPARFFGRGRKIGPTCELRSRYPLGLFEAARLEEYGPGRAGGLIVFPQPILPPALRARLDRSVLDHALASRAAPDVIGELRGIRGYRPGDPFKGIHWPSMARGRPLMVREWDPPQPRPLRFGVLFHSFETPGEIIRPDRFERALQLVSGFLRYCQELSMPVKLLLRAGLARESGVVLAMPEPQPYRRGYEALAFARRQGLRDAGELAALVGEFRDCDHLVIIADSPMRLWKRHVASEKISVVCMDPDAVAVEPRKLRLMGGQRS